MALVQPVTVSMNLLEIMAHISQLSMKLRANIAIRLRAKFCILEERRRKNNRNLKLEIKPLAHTQANQIE